MRVREGGREAGKEASMRTAKRNKVGDQDRTGRFDGEEIRRK